MLFEKRIMVNGKKVPAMKVNEMIEVAVNNIILSGFENVGELKELLNSNSGGSVFVNMKMLNKMLNIYNENLVEEANKVAEAVNAPNIMLLTRKIRLITECYDYVVMSVQKPVVSTVDEDYLLSAEEEDLLAGQNFDVDKELEELEKIVDKKNGGN